MKWCISAFAVFGVIVLGRCQDIGQLKLGILEEIVQISKNIESSIQDMKADMSTLKGDMTSLKDDMSSMKGDITSLKGDMSSLKVDMTSLRADMAYKFEELEKDVSSKQDLLMKEMIFIKKELVQHEEILNQTCNDQLTAIQYSLSEVHEKESQQPEESSNLDLLYQTFADIFDSEKEFQENILKFSCSRHQVETLQNLLATDECLDGTHNCSSSAECKDNIVGFKCLCLDGFEGDGFSCEDVDECTRRLHQCDQVAQCNNEDGNYTCSCPNGYTGDGFNCQDIDECSAAENPCDVNADCSNSDGHYTCSCKSPYIGNGTSCDISCESPSQIIDGLGCVIPVKTLMNWDQAQANCKSLGGRLLEGISSQSQMDQLKKHFFPPINGAHVGYRKLTWIEGGESIDPKSPLWLHGYPIQGNNECGILTLVNSRLFDYPCSTNQYSFCEMK